MSKDDWQAGDLALCVNISRIARHGHIATAGDRFRLGAVYTVYKVSAVNHEGGCRGGPFLYMREDSGKSAGAHRFRKIKPHTPDAEDIITIAMLTGKPAKVGA